MGSSLLKLAGALLKVGAVADREAVIDAKVLTVYERDFSASTQAEKEQRAATIKSFILVLVASLFLLTFVACIVSRRNNPRLTAAGEQQNEEQQMGLIQDAAFEIENHHDDEAAAKRHCLSSLEQKCTIGMQLALINFMIEIPSAVMDQIASENKPSYVLIMMLISFTSMFLCLIELVYKGIKHKITWRWTRRMPWFYYPPPPINRPFGTLTEIIGMSCAIAQSIITAINFYFCRRDHSSPIKFSVWPIIFGFGVVCAKFMASPNDHQMDQVETSTTSDHEDVDNQANVDDQPSSPAHVQQ